MSRKAMHRREAITVLVGALAPSLLRTRSAPPPAQPDFAEIERTVGGRLGVAVLDVATSRRLQYRADERFPMCSTFKWLLVAQVLSKVDTGAEDLTRRVRYGPDDLLEYAPVTRAHVSEGQLSVAELAAAAIQVSDNTAGNLLLASVGGPPAFTAFLRGIGDTVSRLDRIEPDLNSADPGDSRDTTTPAAMIANMQRLLLGDHLRPATRERLLGWLLGSTTGTQRLRSGVPASWRVGDKTGSGGHGATNDIAILWPPGREPVLIAAYLADCAAATPAREAALATVGRQVSEWITGR